MDVNDENILQRFKEEKRARNTNPHYNQTWIISRLDLHFKQSQASVIHQTSSHQHEMRMKKTFESLE